MPNSQRQARRARSIEPRSPGSISAERRGCAQLFAVIAALALPFGWSIRWSFESQVEDVRAAADWPTAPGEILESYVAIPNRTEDEGHAVVGYRYRVNGSNYQSTGHKLDIASWSDDPSAVVARYPVGAEVAVLYKPTDPALSALEAADFDLWDRLLLWLGSGLRWGGGAAALAALAFHLGSRRALRRDGAPGRHQERRPAA